MLTFDRIAAILKAQRPDTDRIQAFANWSKTVRVFSDAVKESGGDVVQFLKRAGHSA